jgi:hypothetical protein
MLDLVNKEKQFNSWNLSQHLLQALPKDKK